MRCLRWLSEYLVVMILLLTGLASAQPPARDMPGQAPASSTPGQPPQYTFRSLGDFIPFALNVHGTLGGSVEDPAQTAARWKSSASTPEDFGVDGRVNAVDAAGNAFGYSGCFDPGCINQEATAWDTVGTKYLYGLLPSGSASALTGAGPDGVACGYGTDASNRIRAILFDRVLMPLVDYGLNAYCDAMNQAEWMAGSAMFHDGYLHAVVWVSPNEGFDLNGFLPSGTFQSRACCITDTYWLAGTFSDATGSHMWRWALWRDARPQVLPDPPGLFFCAGLGLDSNGDVVGLCGVEGPSPQETGVLWTRKDVAVDLSTYAPAGQRVDAATAINHGVITCLQTSTRPPSGCLLVPSGAVSKR
jgi:hypothetical protein